MSNSFRLRWNQRLYRDAVKCAINRSKRRIFAHVRSTGESRCICRDELIETRALMSFAPLGAAISNSLFIRILHEKLRAAPKSKPCRFADHLRNFAELVASEAKFVPLTFPEFTDHSAEHSFPESIYTCWRLLGEKLLRSLHIEELFVLALALYAHDWGMAVSNDERELVPNG